MLVKYWSCVSVFLSVYKTDKGLHNKLIAAWQLDSSQMLLAFAETTKWKRRTMP